MATSEQEQHPQSRSAGSESEAAAGPVASHGISINLPAGARPQPVHPLSAPAYQSPIRHHRRAPSRSKGVKETLNARSHYGSSEDDGVAIHQINQYIIKQEIGRGSFGAVHLATDQYGNEYAVKEFSKSRLRKRAQSNLLRRPNHGRGNASGHLAARMSFNSPLHRHSSSDLDAKDNNAFSLIREEIAIMKKLSHPNVVSLIEVLDDPDEDSLYMVLEMCKKGVVMKVGLDECAEPYGDEACRCWFRDMILGIEYLHAHGIIHRDLKPDNCLINHEDVLKIVDFGVSEMFEKASDMATAKSAGSPAFMPPELCVAKHGPVSGRAADIWSMGVTLYCLRYGHIPFEKTSMLELYECIRQDDVPLQQEQDAVFRDLMLRTLEKDPDKRITMDELRMHAWVTKNGTDPLLSVEENCAEMAEPPTEIEMKHAITGNMGGVMVVMKAVRRFKELLMRKHPTLMEGIFGTESRIVAPPQSVDGPSKSVGACDRQPMESALLSEGVHRTLNADGDSSTTSAQVSGLDLPATGGSEPVDVDHTSSRDDGRRQLHENPDAHRQTHSHLLKSRTFPLYDHAKGHAHDPLTDTLFLDIGPGVHAAQENEDPLRPVVSESPGAVEDNIYERAYQEEMQRILEHRGDDVALHLTRRVDHLEDLRNHPNVLASSLERFKLPVSKKADDVKRMLHASAAGGFAALVKQAHAQAQGDVNKEDHIPSGEEATGDIDGPVVGGFVDDEDHVPSNEEATDGVDGPVVGGYIDDEDHVPTNEEAAGGVDGPRGQTHEATAVPALTKRPETPTAPGAFPST